MTKGKIHCTLDSNFMDHIFYKEKKKLQNKLGLTRLSDPEFSSYLHKANAKIKIPVMDKKFLPFKLNSRRRR